MDLSKLCIDNSEEESEKSSYFQYSDIFDHSNQNVNTIPFTSSASKSNQNSSEKPAIQQPKLYDCTRLKHIIEQCTFLQKDILKYQSQPFTEEIRTIMLNQVYGTTTEMLDSLKLLQESQASIENHGVSAHSEQYKDISDYSKIRQSRHLNNTDGPKYKRRTKRNMVGQHCHSCNTTETPEWRRGPDGARTLCNACGLHYSKLLRKGSITVQTHNYLIESPSTYQRMTQRVRLPELPRSSNVPYLPLVSNTITYNTDSPQSTSPNEQQYIKNWKL